MNIDLNAYKEKIHTIIYVMECVKQEYLNYVKDADNIKPSYTKEYYKNYMREYYKTNKYHLTKVECDNCGAFVCRNVMARHKQSKKCQKTN